MHKRKAVLAGAALGVILLSGCAGGESGNESGWDRPQLPDELPLVSSSTSLPFDAYTLAQDDLTALQQGNINMLQTCASAFGIDVDFSGDYIEPSDLSRAAWGGKFGTEDATHASQYGYHPAPGGEWAFVGGYYIKDAANIQVNPVSGISDDESKVVQSVVYGVTPDTEDVAGSVRDNAGRAIPDGGCWAEVEAKIDAPLNSFIQDAVDLNNLAVADDRVVAAQQKWSKCMQAAGFSFSKVDEPVNSFAVTQLSAEEIDTAVADVGCTESSGWSRIYYAVLSDYQRQAIERDPGKFEGALASEQKRLAAVSTGS